MAGCAFDERIAELAQKYFPGDPCGEERVRQDTEHWRRMAHSHLPEDEGMRIAINAVEVFEAMRVDQMYAMQLAFGGLWHRERAGCAAKLRENTKQARGKQ